MKKSNKRAPKFLFTLEGVRKCENRYDFVGVCEKSVREKKKDEAFADFQLLFKYANIYETSVEWKGENAV